MNKVIDTHNKTNFKNVFYQTIVLRGKKFTEIKATKCHAWCFGNGSMFSNLHILRVQYQDRDVPVDQCSLLLCIISQWYFPSVGTREVLCSPRRVTNHGSEQNSGLDRRSKEIIWFSSSVMELVCTKSISHLQNVHLMEVLTLALSDVSRKIEQAKDIEKYVKMRCKPEGDGTHINPCTREAGVGGF